MNAMTPVRICKISVILLLAFIAGRSIGHAGQQDASVTPDPAAIQATVGEQSDTTDGSADDTLDAGNQADQEITVEKSEAEPAIEQNPVPAQEAGERPLALSIGASYDSDGYGWGWTSALKFEQPFFNIGLTWYINLGYAGYRSIDHDYRDRAGAWGGEAGLNAYFPSHLLERLYIGAGFTSWRYSGTWKDDAGTPFETAGTGVAHTYGLNFHLGYKWFLEGQKGLFIDPSLGLDLAYNDGRPYMFGPAGPRWKAGLAVGKRW